MPTGQAGHVYGAPGSVELPSCFHVQESDIANVGNFFLFQTVRLRKLALDLGLLFSSVSHHSPTVVLEMITEFTSLYFIDLYILWPAA